MSRLNAKDGLLRTGAAAKAGVGAVMLALLAAGGWAIWGGDDQPDPGDVRGGQWYVVEPQSFDLTIVATGELEAKEQVEVKSEVGGRVAILEVIDEGTFVEAGDVLVRLESKEIAEKVEQEQLNVEQATAEQISAEQALEIKRSESTSKIRAAEVKLDLAKLDLMKWQEGELVTKRQELAQALDKAKRRLASAEEDLAFSHQLHDEKFISRGELDADIEEQIEATAALAKAELDIRVHDRYTHQRDLKQKTSDVEQAQAELDRERRTADREIARLEADLASKNRRLKIRRERLAELEQELEACTITAPNAGLVVYKTSVGPRWQRRNPIVQGREVHNDETIIYLPDTRMMVAAVKVHEALLPQVAEGQSVTVTVDARSEAALAGEVSDIAVMAEDGGWLNPNLREYKVKVDLAPGLDGALKPGMRASAEIIVGQVLEAVAVPIHAVFAEGKQRFVYVPCEGGVMRRPVEIGRSSEAFAEVVTGLEAGDMVLLREPRPGEVVETARS